MNGPADSLHRHLITALKKRQGDGELRKLRSIPEGAIDFASNDYLGLAGRTLIQKDTKETLMQGAGGSRLISGNNFHIDSLEEEFAAFYHTESALFLPTGYQANLALISALGRSNDIIFIYDEQVHASIRDALRLTRARSRKFAHNNLSELSKLLAIESDHIKIVIIESLYSMEGDFAPLIDIEDIVSSSGSSLIVDEAHSSGIIGSDGSGVTCNLGLEDKVFARLHTLGKAHGIQGGVIVGSSLLKDYLINFSRPFIYSTGPTYQLINAARYSIKKVQEAGLSRQRLNSLIDYFLEQKINSRFLISKNIGSPIQWISAGTTDELRLLANKLEKNNIYTVPIYPPTVPLGKERIRITLHSFNTKEDIDRLLVELN